MLIKPVVTYWPENWTLTKSDENLSKILERKILRRIHGPVQEGDIWRIRNDKELNKSIKGEDIVKFIKAQRIRWLGHVKRTEVGAMPKKMMEGRLYRTKERKTSSAMDGWRCSRLESNEDKTVDREDERQRAMETGCWGGQSSPRAVAPRGRKEVGSSSISIVIKLQADGLKIWIKYWGEGELIPTLPL